jgi:transposase
MGIMHSQSVKTATPPRRGAYGGADRGIDGHKKMHGRKRHVVTDTVGHLLAVKVTAANVSDQAGGTQVLTALSKREQGHMRQHSARPYRLRKILVDGAYQGIVAAIFILFGWILEVTKKPEAIKTKGFVVQPTRWVIERFHAWQGR